MTELIIDNVHAVLSDDFSCTVKQENSFITKNGEYTYDCTMSLLNPTNAKLYGFLQRINKAESFATKRRVILIADNRVYCDGTEVITKWTNEKVTIQIVSGNSQFNYFIGSEKKVSELDLGKATVDDTTKISALTDFEKMGYAFPPTVIGGDTYNLYDIYLLDDGATFTLKPNGQCGWIAMPFYVDMVEKIITALGYTINSNMLRSSEYRHMIMIHNIDTTEFAKMLPGYTCKEFLEEVEKLFNIEFYIDYKTKAVDIVTQAKFYATAGMVHIKNVKDAYETEIDSDATEDEHSTANIGYDLPSTTYYTFRKLSDDLKKLAVKKSMTLGDAITYFNGTTDTGMELITDPDTDIEYIRQTVDDKDTPLQVDEFKNLIHDSTTTDLGITISIVPAEMTEIAVGWKLPSGVKQQSQMSVATLDSNSTSDNNNKQSTLYGYLENGGYNTSEESKNTLYAAFFIGCICRDIVFSALNVKVPTYPQVYTDETAIIDTATKNVTMREESFRLKTIASEFYDSTYKIDKKNKLTIESYDPNVYDTRLIYEILNKRWICEYIEYTIDKDGRKGTWKGLFHPVTISDTDAEHRWILADKKWRDNGVWIDNGRWLDE
jgi:hypothetical protein